MKLRLYAKGQKIPKDLVQVEFFEGKLTYPYTESTKVVPLGANHVGVYVEYGNDYDAMPLMAAARQLASAGLFRIFCTNFTSYIPQNVPIADCVVLFLRALYNGSGQDIEAALGLEKKVCAHCSELFEIVTAARELADTGSRDADPEETVRTAFTWVEQAAARHGGTAGLTIVTPEQQEFDRYAGLKAVGKGSLACMGIIDFLPEGSNSEEPLVALVGKGITFDSGGYNLKPDHWMDDMRTDKTGAVNVAAALAYAIACGTRLHIRVYLPCAQNLVTSASMVPGDVITYPDGTRVEIGNTDCEGRLVLADALLQAQDDGARLIVDAATLTGAAKAAVGRDISCYFLRDCEHVDFADDIKNESYCSYDSLWQLPLFERHRRYLKTRRADISNCGHGVSMPGASVAALFLAEFVKKDVIWLHIDLSSAYLPEGSPYLAPGPTGALISSLGQCLLPREEGDDPFDSDDEIDF